MTLYFQRDGIINSFSLGSLIEVEAPEIVILENNLANSSESGVKGVDGSRGGYSNKYGLLGPSL